MARSIIDVCNQLLEVIPESEIFLRDDINNYIRPHWNKAPEVLSDGFHFQIVASILCTHIRDSLTTNERWKLNVLHIFNNTSTTDISQ